MVSDDHVWFGMKVTPEQKRMIERLAERRATSQKEVVLEAVRRAYGEDEKPVPEPGTFLDGIEHLVGSVEGPSDLSSDPKHLKGYGR